jgi:lysyl-tRNA synthetase class 2
LAPAKEGRVTGGEWWRPERLAERRPFLTKRAAILRAVRAWFEAQAFEEVETPALQVSPGIEPHLHAFATELRGAQGERMTRYLHTSPEYAMKKLLVAGMTRIYQLAHVYRNEQQARLHSPEFTMLEWYRAGAGYATGFADCVALLRLAARAAENDVLLWDGIACDPFAQPEILTVAGAFERHAGIDLLATSPDPVAPSLELLAAAGERVGIEPHAGDSWEDLFFRIMLERIEPKLGAGRPTILSEYPVSMAALARPKPDDPRVAERFELYACGVELANGFGELTDATVQRRRFQADQALKQRLYGDEYPIDEDFLAALAFGMPEASGVALGFDRLVMLAAHAPEIEAVLWAPVV